MFLFLRDRRIFSAPLTFKFSQSEISNACLANMFLSGTHSLNTLACRFAILSGPTIPIIGEGDEEANDRCFCYFCSIPFPSMRLEYFELYYICTMVFILSIL